MKNGKPMYTNVSNQFVSLVKGEYGKTPVPVDPDFRLRIAKVEEETPYDTSRHCRQENPVLEELGGVRLAANEKEELLLELFPAVAKTFLTNRKEALYQSTRQAEAAKQSASEAKNEAPVTGKVVVSPMPGNVYKILVQPGDTVCSGQEVLILESMKMENSIASEYAGTVKRILTKTGANVPEGGLLIEIDN
jgi:biotin carboxyl carrier protein